jgi:hypothetical protein
MRVNKYYVPDETKAKIVRFVFEMYATGECGMGELAKLVRDRFKSPYFSKKVVETML